MNKLQKAAQKKTQLIQQETEEWDQSSIIRQALKDGFTPEEWHNGYFPPVDEPLPDIFYIRPSDGHAVIWWDYDYTKKQAKWHSRLDAIRSGYGNYGIYDLEQLLLLQGQE
jgi:hypothetical protein